MVGPTNSKITRVQPVFSYLEKNGGSDRPARLVEMAHDVAKIDNCGAINAVYLNPERKVLATAERLIWMLENAGMLAPYDGRRWSELRKRLENRDAVRKAIESLKAGKRRQTKFVLEGDTSADCLIECEHSLIWIEGKRFDWLAPHTTWDVSRDQLARNVEAAWSLACEAKKEYRVLICHEYPLKHHEDALLKGYRAGTWSAGWPHIPESERPELAKRIGTLTWGEITGKWSGIPMLDGDSRLAISQPTIA